jgi:hypothetical protein
MEHTVIARRALPDDTILALGASEQSCGQYANKQLLVRLLQTWSRYGQEDRLPYSTNRYRIHNFNTIAIKRGECNTGIIPPTESL